MAGIYVHIPFCGSFCTYCDFYSILDHRCIDSYITALLSEMDRRKEFFDVIPSTVYIGGGTPSQLSIAQMTTLVQHLSKTFFADTPHGIRDTEEFTVEVNPDDITPEYASALRNLGINRISMGVQSFDDTHLRWMNRRHTSSEAIAAFHTLRNAGFDNISLDLIFGYRPTTISDDTLMTSWQRDLAQIIDLHPEHISAYQMSVEPGSTLGEMASRGQYEEPSQELCAAQYELLQTSLRIVGYLQYEVSNFALPGFHSRHNSSYWERQPYIGLGPAAHSFIGTRRSWNPSDLKQYLSLQPPTFEDLTPENILDETVMLGLRKTVGFHIWELSPEYRPSILSHAHQLSARGLLTISDDTISIPPDKLFISEYIIEELLG